MGTLTTNWATADLLEFAGSGINLLDGDISGRDLAFRNGGATGDPANEGNWFQFQISTVGLTELVMSYAGRTTSTGMRSLTWSYSTDGIAFTNFQTVDHFDLFGGANYGLVTVDFSSVAAASGAAAFFVRGTFATLDGQSNPQAAGNTRFDNFQFQAIPEPSTYAAIVGALFLGLVLYRRRAR
ncbi:MAG: PEP-CTERM sorting domain-containing protein [Opitutales bacterium]|nr:PEP-CTERM sorting domain-containing protein [Opitutales bacterium]